MEKIEQAEQLLKEANYSDAVALLLEIHQACPQEESVLMMLAWAYYDSGNASRAEEYLKILLQRELSRKIFTGFAFDELVRIYREKKEFDKLIEICLAALAVQPDDIGLLTEMGNAYRWADRTEEACQIYEKLIELENDNSSFYCLLGEALFAAGQIPQARKAFLQAADFDSEHADHYYYKIADLYSKSGLHVEAKLLLKKCIAASPANPLYYCSLGDELIHLDEIKKALLAYETAAQKDRSNAGAYYNRMGNTLLQEKKFDRAADAFRKAINCESLALYHDNLTVALEAAGKQKTSLTP